LNRPTLQDRWFDAAAANRVAEVGDLLVSHPELLNASDERTDSRTALDLAMQHPDRLLATRLVEAGADPNHRDPVTGKPPLVRIAELGVAGENDDHNIALVAALIRHGARVSDVDPASLESGSGVWSLITFDTFIVAVANDDRETVIDQIGREPHLVRATVSGSSISALHVAAYRGSTKLVDSLLDRGAEIDRATTGPVPAGYFDFVEREIPSGTTPLLAAVQAGHASTVGRLLARGADPSTIDESGFSPMRMAVRDGRVEIVDQLIRAAPDSVLESDAAGESTLVTAARLGHVEVVARLLDTDRFDDVQAQRAEDAARERGLDGTVSSIAAWRSATNARAFRRAVQDGDVDAVERLLEADPGLLNAEGTPPLRIAATHGHAAMVDVLLGRDGGWAAGEDGRGSPLTDALAAGHVEVVRRLVGSDQCDATYLKIRDTAGRSPLQLAAPDWETVSILVNSAACTEDVILQPVREDGSTILEMLCEKPSPTCAELLNLVIREKVAAGSLDGSLKRPLDVLARSGELPSVVDAAAASTMARTLLDADRQLLNQAPFESALRAGSEGVATVLLDAKPGLSVDPIADGSGRLYPVQLLDHAKTSSLRERLVVDSLRALFRDEPYDPALLDALKADLDTPFAMGDEATSSKVAALEHAVTRSTEPLVRALIDRDVSLECSASQGTLLHVALGATSVSESIVEAVGNALRGKAGLATALGKRDGQGRTPIELAVDTGAVTVVDLVLKWMDE
ncbi:MAG: ankyrin repeat domain-containing protein, partial [Phycisphaerales bacterium]|nr:ankyrin repeat domain-containing protein [Phycisphaerales bacterium]